MISINLKNKKSSVIIRFLDDVIKGIESNIHEQNRIIAHPTGSRMYPSMKIKYPDMDKTAEIRILIYEIKIEFWKALGSVFGGRPIERRIK